MFNLLQSEQLAGEKGGGSYSRSGALAMDLTSGVCVSLSGCWSHVMFRSSFVTPCIPLHCRERAAGKRAAEDWVSKELPTWGQQRPVDL